MCVCTLPHTYIHTDIHTYICLSKNVFGASQGKNTNLPNTFFLIGASSPFQPHIFSHTVIHTYIQTCVRRIGLGGSVGCAFRLETRRSWVQPPPRCFGNILSWRLIMKYFYVHSLPSADSRRAVVSFWRKNVHNTG